MTTLDHRQAASGRPVSSSPASPGLLRRSVQWVFNFPIFYKILIANTLLVSASAVAGSWLGDRFPWQRVFGIQWGLAVGVALASLAAVVTVNYFLVRTALQPLTSLTRLLTALRRGEWDARAERTLFGDSERTRLIHLANNLLDELEAYQKRVEELSVRVTGQLETERKNISRELHDGTAQKLAALLAMLQLIAQTPDDAARADLIKEAKELTRLTLEGVRRLAVGLRPAILDTRGLPGALRWYVQEVMDRVLPPVTLDLDQTLNRLPPVAELALYRIAQEALSNISRHANAAHVQITLRRDGDHALMQVIDDGVGFDVDSPTTHQREFLGLFTIKERARLAGGNATVTSERGKGTTVSIRVPLKGT